MRTVCVVEVIWWRTLFLCVKSDKNSLFLGSYLVRDQQDLDDLFALHHTKENRSDPVRQSDVEQ